MATSKNILLINGPNLNLLGSREPEQYGTETLQGIESRLAELAKKAGVRLSACQSNSEAELVEHIQQAGRDKVDFIIINPAAYTHTSVAIRDALAAVALPTVEVHLSNIHQREEFRHHSYIAGVAMAQLSGFGPAGYLLALQGLLEHLLEQGVKTGAAASKSVRRTRRRNA